MKRVLAAMVGLSVLAFCSWAAAGPGCCNQAKSTSASAACDKAEKATAAACDTKACPASACAVKTVKLSIEGMHCGSCSKAVQTALAKLEGVQAAKVSYTRKNAEVKYNPARLNEETIIQAVNATGFTATIKSSEAKMSSEAGGKDGSKAEAASAHGDCCKAKKSSQTVESGT